MTESDGKLAYESAQKKRNLYIGLALGGFVILVFFVSISRMSQGVKNDANQGVAAESTLSGAVQ
ncbi:MAG: hypothetical protein WBQ60_01790 [Asticcacaulis sp.]